MFPGSFRVPPRLLPLLLQLSLHLRQLGLQPTHLVALLLALLPLLLHLGPQLLDLLTLTPAAAAAPAHFLPLLLQLSLHLRQLGLDAAHPPSLFLQS